MSELKRSTIEKIIRKNSKLIKIDDTPTANSFMVIEIPQSTTAKESILFNDKLNSFEQYLKGMCVELNKFEYIQLGNTLYKNTYNVNNGICFCLDLQGFWSDYNDEIKKLWPGESIINWISDNIPLKYITAAFAATTLYSFFNSRK